MAKWWMIATAVAVVAVLRQGTKHYGWDIGPVMNALKELSERLGIWAIPTYVAVHTVTLALCLPYAVVFESAAPGFFGFLPAIICVFSAKVLAASLSFWIGRLVFRSSSSAMGWAQRNKYFNVLLTGVERDGWKFVLLARFSPIPSYIINYALAATKVRFLADFLLPTVMGCLPMIIQNASVGSLASIAVTSAAGQPKTQLMAYVFPVLGIFSSVLISMRIRKYAARISTMDASPPARSGDSANAVDGSHVEKSK
ncbi:PREDICTED: uncharacterized protein LOC104801410 [Tarenaya hassleriana]|uniref:uncharacterized protein LOC104801410 n=1 Tax=Tarenaya hassleriana TaxID=28532 RepID=UPI00053C2323|nr:PREDICTED: uncharacterized protein LOC104801410 [Tarenaya hassleriana]